MRPDIKTSSDGSVIVTGKSVEWVERALNHQEYLDSYRKGYSQRSRAKLQAVKEALKSKGVDVKKLEAEAIAKLRAQED